MWPAMLIGAAAGAGKYYDDKKKEKRDRIREAEIARYSPWTGMHAKDVQEASLLNNVMQGGMAGMTLGQGMDAADAQGAMQEKQGGLVDAQTNYYNSLAGPQGGYATPVQPPAGSAGSMGMQPSPWNGMQPYGPQRP